MPNSIEDYRNLIEQPWGKMFYDMVFAQLDISKKKRLNILDYGAGFCVTAEHYGKNHNVTAVEPSEDMLDLRIKSDNYELVQGGLSTLADFEQESFDLVICHNVLEYVEEKEKILDELSRVLKSGGCLSVVKHNLTGRIVANAIFDDNPKAAMKLLDSAQDCGSNLFGNRSAYPDEWLISEMKKNGLEGDNIFGIRTFFGLSKNFDAKRSEAWYRDMLELEMKVCDMEGYKNIAFFHHLLFTKER